MFSLRGSAELLRTYSKKSIRALGCEAKRWMKSAGLAGGHPREEEDPSCDDATDPDADSMASCVHKRIRRAVVSSGLLVTSIFPYFFSASTALGDDFTRTVFQPQTLVFPNRTGERS